MKTAWTTLAVFAVALTHASSAVRSGDEQPLTLDVEALRSAYEQHVATLGCETLEADHPKIVRDLRSGQQDRESIACRMLAHCRDPRAIPWLVPLLDGASGSTRAWAGSAISCIVSECALMRRDPEQLGRIALQPRRPGDPDLRPFTWLAVKMMRAPEAANLRSYGADVARYVEARELAPDLRKLLDSRHPAVRNAAVFALQGLGFEVDEAAVLGPLHPIPRNVAPPEVPGNVAPAK